MLVLKIPTKIYPLIFYDFSKFVKKLSIIQCILHNFITWYCTSLLIYIEPKLILIERTIILFIKFKFSIRLKNYNKLITKYSQVI